MLRAQNSEVTPDDKKFAAAQLFEEAQDRLNYDDYDAAIRYMQQAAALDPQEQDYVSAYGSLLAEVGKADEALTVLQNGVQRFPDVGFEKYMYLGQLLEGEAAIQNLQKGIQILTRQAKQEADREEAKELSSQLASGLCSLAELHMASPDREVDDIARQCEPLLEQARQADATSPEPIQVLASLRNEQGRADEALDLLQQSMALWFRPSRHDGEEEDAGSSRGSEEEAGSEEEDMDEDLATPSFEFRFECAKLLIELDETTENAIQILEDLLQENDQAVHVVFLLAMAQHAGGDDEAALETITSGEDLMQRLQVPGDDPAALGFSQLKERIQSAKTEA